MVRHLLLANDQTIRSPNLPNQPATSMTDTVALTDANQFTDPFLQCSLAFAPGLADIDDEEPLPADGGQRRQEVKSEREHDSYRDN